MKNVKIVVGANFGDEGKGLMTDYFANGSDSIVVLSNGGAQRGHTVTRTNGIRHVFHHFGSGIFNGAVTYFPKEFILNPMVFRQEYEELNDLGYTPISYCGFERMITTPWDMMANQIIEAHRGIGKHGSCGMGIFETIQRERSGIESEDYDRILSYYNRRFIDLGVAPTSEEKEIFYSAGLRDHFKDDYDFMWRNIILAEDDCLNWFKKIVFENGQGLMLDQNNSEYFPNLTPSNTGVKNPKAIIDRIEWNEPLDIEVCYVTRTYLTRHGAGKLPGECDKTEINPYMEDLTNVPNPNQDSLRYGMMDWEAMLERCLKDLDGWDVGLSLAITHINEYPVNRKMMELLKCRTYLSKGHTNSDVEIAEKREDIEETENENICRSCYIPSFNDESLLSDEGNRFKR